MCRLVLAALASYSYARAGRGNGGAGGTCGNEGGASPPPCRVPPWPATWQMNASTIIMPCNYTGYQVPKTVAGWGIVDFDWSNNLAGWSSATPMDNDERQLDQVKMIKDDPATADYTKVWIYRNTIKASHDHITVHIAAPILLTWPKIYGLRLCCVRHPS